MGRTGPESTRMDQSSGLKFRDILAEVQFAEWSKGTSLQHGNKMSVRAYVSSRACILCLNIAAFMYIGDTPI